MADKPDISALGFDVVPNFLSSTEEHLAILNCQTCLRDAPNNKAATKHKGGRSRVARFGYDYSTSKFLSEVPEWLQVVTRKFHALKIETRFDSVTVNEYQIGCGIVPHVDSWDFANLIVILNLLCDCEMTLSKPGFSTTMTVPRRSLTLLRGEIRYHWMHSISAVKGTRYSVVFRNRVHI